MKNFLKLSLACFCLVATSTFAQNNSGKITYEEKMKIEIKLSGDASQFKDLIPKERKSEMTLLFTPEASLYAAAAKKNNDQTIEQNSGGAQMQIVMKQPDNKVYVDLAAGTRIEQRDFMGRMFLIESESKQSDWKLTGEQKMIMNYPCQQATKTVDDKKIVAWFTPAIPVSAGPQSLSGLPGLVLEADINDGQLQIAAKDIQLQAIEKGTLTKPSKGKKTTKEEYKKMVDEKTKEMQQQYGGSGNGANVIIQTHTR